MPPNETDIVKVIIVGTAVILSLGGAVIFFVILYKRRQSSHKKEKKKMENTFREELLHAQLEIREQTFKNISQEIHDNIGQTLSLAKLNLNTLDLLDTADREQKLLNTKELVGKAITDLRSLSKTMNTDTIVSAGLLKAIEFELGMINRTGTIHAAIQTIGVATKLDARKELILFRIVQESLNNIIKHSEARNIKVSAYFQNNLLELSIADDGKGFDPNTSLDEFESGSGLRNMKSRATLIGGRLDIYSNQGTQIKITLPINEA